MHKRVSTSIIYISGNFGLGSVTVRVWYGRPEWVTRPLLTLENGICHIS